ncbi:MAG: transposase [Deltaproteobacteria bacterium]|nr:transposase [Deltaproteobacteria bacterium]
MLAQLERLDEELGDIEYVIGLAKNSRLLEAAVPLRTRVAEEFADGVRQPILASASRRDQQGRAWRARRESALRRDQPQRALARADPDVAFCARGQSENFIKDYKNALQADRLSCHRFVANAFRLLLHAIAYRLMHALRTAVAEVAPSELAVETDRVRLPVAQMDTLRVRLLKVAAHVTTSVRRVLVRLPRAFPLAHVFLALAARLAVT